MTKKREQVEETKYMYISTSPHVVLDTNKVEVT